MIEKGKNKKNKFERKFFWLFVFFQFVSISLITLFLLFLKNLSEISSYKKQIEVLKMQEDEQINSQMQLSRNFVTLEELSKLRKKLEQKRCELIRVEENILEREAKLEKEKIEFLFEKDSKESENIDFLRQLLKAFFVKKYAFISPFDPRELVSEEKSSLLNDRTIFPRVFKKYIFFVSYSEANKEKFDKEKGFITEIYYLLQRASLVNSQLQEKYEDGEFKIFFESKSHLFFKNLFLNTYIPCDSSQSGGFSFFLSLDVVDDDFLSPAFLAFFLYYCNFDSWKKGSDSDYVIASIFNNDGDTYSEDEKLRNPSWNSNFSYLHSVLTRSYGATKPSRFFIEKIVEIMNKVFLDDFDDSNKVVTDGRRIKMKSETFNKLSNRIKEERMNFHKKFNSSYSS